MPSGIIITGASGAGKTTLGRFVAEKLGFSFLDIDDFLWRKDTEIPFSKMYSREEKISRLMEAVQKTEHFVMSGSMDSFHEHFDGFFDLAVLLNASPALRVRRVHARELEWFSERILPGGDMYEAHEAFLKEIASYDGDGAVVSFKRHEAWLSSLSCPFLKLDGADEISQNAEIIISAWMKRNGI